MLFPAGDPSFMSIRQGDHSEAQVHAEVAVAAAGHERRDRRLRLGLRVDGALLRVLLFQRRPQPPQQRISTWSARAGRRGALRAAPISAHQ